jgi:hypothetical protein
VFPLLFFVLVELPSMAVMLIHKIIMIVTGKGSTGRPLPIFLYRIIGVAGLGVVLVLGVTAAAIGSGVGWDNGASGSPGAAVEQYVRVALVQRDAARAQALACRAPKVEDINGLRDEILQQEQRFGVRITVYTSSMAVIQQDGAGAAVQADLSVTIPQDVGGMSVQVIAIQFTVVQESGWRVCSAARLR